MFVDRLRRVLWLSSVSVILNAFGKTRTDTHKRPRRFSLVRR